MNLLRLSLFILFSCASKKVLEPNSSTPHSAAPSTYEVPKEKQPASLDGQSLMFDEVEWGAESIGVREGSSEGSSEGSKEPETLRKKQSNSRY